MKHTCGRLVDTLLILGGFCSTANTHTLFYFWFKDQPKKNQPREVKSVKKEKRVDVYRNGLINHSLIKTKIILSLHFVQTLVYVNIIVLFPKIKVPTTNKNVQVSSTQQANSFFVFITEVQLDLSDKSLF